jgi:hypothetical protein
VPGDQEAAGERIAEGLTGGVCRARTAEILGSQTVDANRSSRHDHRAGIDEVVHRPVDPELAAVDGHHTERDDPIPREVEAGRLEVERGEGCVLPAPPPFR